MDKVARDTYVTVIHVLVENWGSMTNSELIAKMPRSYALFTANPRKILLDMSDLGLITFERLPVGVRVHLTATRKYAKQLLRARFLEYLDEQTTEMLRNRYQKETLR